LRSLQILVWPIALVVLVLAGGGLSDAAESRPAPASLFAAPPDTKPVKKKLLVGGDHDYPPYEFLDHGKPRGFNIDLIRAVAEVMDFDVEIRLGPWRQIRTDLEQGRLDVLGFNHSKEREKSFDFSIPLVLTSPGLFVRTDSRIRSFDDLRGKEVIVQDGDILHDSLLKWGLAARIVTVQDADESLRLLAAGKHDALLMSSKFYGLYTASKLGLANLKAVPTDLPLYRYCFAVRKGNQALVHQLDEGLMILKATGKYQEIYDKWFGVYEPRHFALSRSWTIALVIIAGVAGASLLWSWTLRRQVRLRTAELRTSEERFRALVEQAPEAIVVHDSQKGRFVEANQSAERLFGCSRTELLRVGPPHFYPPEQPDGRPVDESVAEHLAQAAAGQELVCDRRIRNAQGREIYCEVRLTQLPSIGRGMTRISYLDITDRKRAEEMTRLEEVRLKSVLKLSQYPAASYRELLDAALDEIVALSDSRLGYIFFYSEEKREFTLHAWSKQAMQECAVPNPPTVYQLDETGIWGEPVRQRRPLILNDFQAPNPLKKGCPEGHVAISRFMTVPVFRDGRIVAVAGVANKPTAYVEADVRQLTLMMDWFWRLAERRLAEDALRESEERFRILIEQAPEAILVHDVKQNRFVEANHNAMRLFGCDREELLRSGPQRFYAPSQPDGRPIRESMQEHVTRVLAGEEIAFERVIHPLQGGEIYCDVRLVRLPSTDGPLLRASYIDITERKRAEAELRRHRDHLEELVHERTAELATANQALAQRSAQLRALASQLIEAEQRERRRIAHVLHENFQQLLAAAKFSLQLFRDKGQATAADHAMESLDEAIAVSRSLTVELRPPILYELGLGPALEWLARQKSQKFDLTVQLHLGHQAEPASDSLRMFLFEAARELLLNVAKHAQVKTADVTLSRVGNQIQLQVADRGAGFDPAQPPSGFGLFSIRERVELLGGHIEVASRAGSGTCVTLSVPPTEPVSRAF
jgi:PAS domain S-box-containing protein